MPEQVIILNIPSEPELIYTYEGVKISKQRLSELKTQFGTDLEIINKDLPDMKVFDPRKRSLKSDDIAFEEDFMDDEGDVLNEIMSF